MHDLVNPMTMILLWNIFTMQKNLFLYKERISILFEYIYTIQKYIVDVLFKNILHTLILLNKVGRVYGVHPELPLCTNKYRNIQKT